MINIVIGTQQPIFRTGLAKLIAAEDDFRIVAQPVSLAHLHNAIEKLRPRVVLLSTDFFSTQAELASVVQLEAECGFSTLVLIDRNQQALEFVTMGVRGVLPRSVHSETLMEGIRRTAGGEVCLRTTSDADSSDGIDLVGKRVASRLTRREIKIVEAMLRGNKNADIARQLGVTVPLVKKYIGGIYDKAGVWGRLELALFMMHHEVLALAYPDRNQAGFPADLRVAADRERAAVERMFGPAAKSERRAGIGSRSRGTCLGTTGAAPEYGK